MRHTSVLCLFMAAFASLQIATAQAPQSAADRALWMKANGAYDSGNQLMGRKRYKEAIAKYKEAIAVWPGDWNYHYNLALALKHSGNGPEAVTAFRKVLELNSTNWKCWKALGNTQWRLGQFADAKASFENALKYAPVREVPELKSGIAACAARAQ